MMRETYAFLCLSSTTLELVVKYEFLSTEKTYCLYRLKQDDEALKQLELKDLETKNLAQLHLAAQLARPILWLGKTAVPI
ncbi:hypothetical protein PsorP6_006018 [Peronosclerospora sorghi]|uniref:Uncharacterized protein n=1 Tax=Peronosclerospora sorghi TaxID=230839 RepID=A0ACC0W5X6_9STRA|nr:hypothetical protein PsorP6_006018 [Peronosclerospora sorghi]